MEYNHIATGENIFLINLIFFFRMHSMYLFSYLYHLNYLRVDKFQINENEKKKKQQKSILSAASTHKKQKKKEKKNTF